MRNFIILEGPDGAGKTTLGRHMAETVPNSVYFHSTCTQWLIPGIYDYMENVVENMLVNAKNGRTVIMDRSWISERVYGTVIGRGVDVQRVLRMHNSVVLHPSIDPIIVYASFSSSRKIIEQEHGYNPRVAQGIIAEYADVMEYFDSPDSPVIPYNWSIDGGDLTKFTEKVLTYDW